MARIIKSNALTFALCAVITMTAAIFYAAYPLLSDVAYSVAADVRILAGAIPYTDILETNPPLMFWFTMPAIWISQLFNTQSELMFVVYTLAINAASLGFAWYLSGFASRTRYERNYLAATLALITCFAMAFGFGQREYFTAVLLLPYLASCNVRLEGGKIPFVAKIAVGVVAGVALAFKPYFLFIPLCVETNALLATRNWKSVFRTDVVVGTAMVAIYPFLVWSLYPQYFTDILPMITLTYGAYKIPFLQLLQTTSVLLFLAIAAGSLILKKGNTIPSRSFNIWFFAGIGGLLSYLFQAKGFPYHMVPALTFALTAFFLQVRILPRPLLQMLAYLGFAVCVVAGLSNYATETRSRAAAYDDLLASTNPKRMMVFSADIGMAFPFLTARKIEWVGHFQSLWMLPAVNQGAVSGTEATTLVAKIANLVSADLEHFHPDFVIVDNRRIARSQPDYQLGFIQQFSQSLAFVKSWQSYKLAKKTDNFELWQRTASF